MAEKPDKPKVTHCPCCGSTEISPVPATTRGGGQVDEIDVRCYSCGEETVIRHLGSRDDDMRPFEPDELADSSN